VNWFDQKTWEFINTFSGWVSGVGSLFAVLVALYLARQDRRVKIDISADFITVIGPMKSPKETIGIRLFNPNRRIAQINLICWVSKIRRKGFLTQSFEGDPNLPVQLKDNEEVVLTIPENHMLNNLREFNFLLGAYPKLMIHFIRVVAVTSGGKKFMAKPGPKLRKWILQTPPGTKQ